jgi:hypothetical protein
MITAIVVVALLLGFGASGATRARCGPTVTYCAPHPTCFLECQCLGAPCSDCQVVYYQTPPTETVLIVKQRIPLSMRRTHCCCRRR